MFSGHIIDCSELTRGIYTDIPCFACVQWKKVTGLHKNKQKCLPNKGYLSVDGCERMTISAKCEYL